MGKHSLGELLFDEEKGHVHQFVVVKREMQEGVVMITWRCRVKGCGYEYQQEEA